MDEAMADTAARAGKVFQEVLERQAFMFAEPASADALAAVSGGFLSASMGFRGEALGRATLCVTRELANTLTADFLGMDASDPEVAARSADCLKETLNVACGNVLTALRGTDPVFELSIPDVAEVDGGTVAAWADKPEALIFQVDEEPLVFLFRFDGAPGETSLASGNP